MALLMAAGFGVVGGFMAAPLGLGWLLALGTGIALLVYVTTVVASALQLQLPEPEPVASGSGRPESPQELRLRARRAGAQVPLAGPLMKVLDNHMLRIIDVEASDGDHSALITVLR